MSSLNVKNENVNPSEIFAISEKPSNLSEVLAADKENCCAASTCGATIFSKFRCNKPQTPAH
jgi:hypothetical protein